VRYKGFFGGDQNSQKWKILIRSFGTVSGCKPFNSVQNAISGHVVQNVN
jgi:hypothetical protein